MTRISEVEPPDWENVPTCGNCGEDMWEGRWYDNDRFMYICRACAEAVLTAAVAAMEEENEKA